MPYSSASGKAWSERIIKRLIAKCRNNSILDVGAGAGNYHDLLRSQLPATKFDGLEIWEPYIAKYSLEEKYDHMIKADIRDFTPQKIYGITLLGDILEHMTKEEAIKVYYKLLNSSEYVLISIPVVNYPQDAYMGNPYEKHIKDDWSHNEVLSSFDCLSLYHLENEIGIYIGYNPKLQKKEELLEANKPSCAVYGIYKNEEKFMERFLNSVKDADEIVLCDTGSNDQTNIILQNFKELNPGVNLKTYKICVSPWRFDDARNTALSLIDGDMDICISLDIDEYPMENWREVLSNRWDLNFTRYYHKFKTIWANGRFSAHWHERIHKRCGYTWKLPVHEILEYQGEEKICWIDDFWIYHEPDHKKSRSSYLPMLEQSIKERPDVWKTWSFLAGEYLSASRYEEALAAIDKALTLKDSDKGYLHKMKYDLYKNQNKQELAMLNLNTSISYLPNRREPYFEKARYLHQLGRNVEAYLTLIEAKNLNQKITDYHYNPSCWDEEFDKFMRETRELAQKEWLLYE
jgi:glycosyltransferase involved in cell wall biosynthesis/trans-aconitate methyltransferase